jgi:hypothetical protein
MIDKIRNQARRNRSSDKITSEIKSTDSSLTTSGDRKMDIQHSFVTARYIEENHNKDEA